METQFNPAISAPYGNTQYGYGGSIGYGNGPASCTGTITAIFDWIPDLIANPDPAAQANDDPSDDYVYDPNDTPPQQVIVSEYCKASYSSQYYYTQSASGGPTGSCDNGLGFAPVPNSYPINTYSPNPPYYQQIGVGIGGVSQGTRYTKQAGAATITLTCSPSATANTPNGPCLAEVFYYATVTPLTVELAGGIGPSYNKRYLIGQKVTATLNPGGLTPTSYDWSAIGGNPFKNWTADQNSTNFTPLGTETGSSFGFYFKTPDIGTVTCASHLSVPPGAHPAAGFDVIVTNTCAAQRPDSASISVEIGYVVALPIGGPFTDVQLQRFYYYPDSGDAAGMEYKGEVTTPADFVNAYGSTGAWNWTQLITPYDQRKNNGVWQQISLSLPPPANPPYRIIYGVQCLDNTYPYDGWYSADGPLPDGTLPGNADSPHEPLEADPLITAKDILDSFDCWFMYQPPGTDSVAVPLKKLNWFWEFHATKSSGTWSVFDTLAQWGYDGDYPAHPKWSFSLSNGGLDYKP